MDASERACANPCFVMICFCFFFFSYLSVLVLTDIVQNLIGFLYVFCIDAYVSESRILVSGVLYFLCFFKPMLKYKHTKENIYTSAFI